MTSHALHSYFSVFAAGVLLTWMPLGAMANSLLLTIPAEQTDLLPVPLALDAEGLSIREGQTIHVYRVDGDRKIPLPAQLETGRTARLWFIPDQVIPKGQPLHLELTADEAPASPSPLTAAVNDTAITLRHHDTPILSYHHAEYPVPDGLDPVYRRSGFIHPLYTPGGMIVTRIQPPGHPHHYGLWNPWTKTKIEGRSVDFWNLQKKEGRVRFAGLLSTVAGPVYTGLKVHHEHVMYGRDGQTERIALNEVWDIRASAVTLDGRTVWIIDAASTLSNALTTPIELETHTYGGGMGFRATDDWTKENLSVLTSQGITRNDANGTRARWIDFRGAGPDKSGTAGIAFFSHTANREHPEPVRVWPDNLTEQGLMMFNFSPIRNAPWTLKPHRDYTLRYRMVLYDGTLPPDLLDTLWHNFTHPPTPYTPPGQLPLK